MQDSFPTLSEHSSSSKDHNKQYEEVTLHNKKIYNCLLPNCGKTFKFKSEMKRHLTIHSNERPFTCTFPDCGKTFKRADALSNHTRIHSRTTPFNCPVPECMSQFTTKSALRYHLLKHTGEKIFKCNYNGCNKAFITYAQLKQHEKANYYHQKVSDVNENEQDFHMEPSEQGMEEVRLDGNEDFFEFNPLNADNFERKFEEATGHKNFDHQPQDLSKFEPKKGKFNEKFNNSSNSSEASTGEKKIESTLMKMLDFMMKENQDLKKQLKYTSDMLQSNQMAQKMPRLSQGNTDNFFRLEQDEWMERSFDAY